MRALESGGSVFGRRQQTRQTVMPSCRTGVRLHTLPHCYMFDPGTSHELKILLRYPETSKTTSQLSQDSKQAPCGQFDRNIQAAQSLRDLTLMATLAGYNKCAKLKFVPTLCRSRVYVQANFRHRCRTM